MNSAAILERFRRGRSQDIDLTLRMPYRDLLADLGNPHDNLPNVIHVAGTNGKGSVCAFMRAALEAAGYRVHVYTSPHLVSFHERIRIAGNLISEEELAEILSQCERLSEPGAITYFEAATAAAFTAFSRYPADVTILEVGLGGRLDATNVVEEKAATVITRLSYDHREYLGETLASIATEKAGIMRKGVPCFVAPQTDAEAVSALRLLARESEVRLYLYGDDWVIEKINGTFRFAGGNKDVELPRPALVGEHQLYNAGLALATLSALPLEINKDAMREAMKTVSWPARLQHIEDGRLARLLPPGWELWLDGGHNDSAGEALAEQAVKWKRDEGKDKTPLMLVCGMLSTKYPAEFLSPLLPHVASVRTVTIPHENLTLHAQELTAKLRDCGYKKALPADSVEAAIIDLIKNSDRPARILICGSLYLAGHVLKVNG